MDEEILKGKTLLVVDDEPDLRDIVASELEFIGAKVFQAENILQAQKVLDDNHIDLIISDIRMPGGTGIDLLDMVKAKNADMPTVILITGFADISIEDAFNKGAEALLNKPFKLDDLIKIVVRQTSSLDDRFKEQGQSQKTLKIKLDQSKVKFGRGGLSMEFDTNGKRIDIGELIHFNFEYESEQFEGNGICRWLRQPSPGTQTAVIGLEFMNLTSQTFGQLKKINAAKKVIPFIPSFNS
jgi:CheY-like chemotaxis protein